MLDRCLRLEASLRARLSRCTLARAHAHRGGLRRRVGSPFKLRKMGWVADSMLPPAASLGLGEAATKIHEGKSNGILTELFSCVTLSESRVETNELTPSHLRPGKVSRGMVHCCIA